MSRTLDNSAPRYAARACAYALWLTAAACTARGETTPPAADGAKPGKTAVDDDAELRTYAGALIDVSAAIREGALERGAQACAPAVTWEVRGVDPHTLRGREDLRQDWSDRDVTAMTFARVFLAADDLVIGQGSITAGSTVYGMVLFARVEDGQIVEVLEHLAPVAGERDPSADARAVIIGGEIDAVREVMAAVLDQAWTSRDWKEASKMFGEGFAYHNFGAGLETQGMDAYRAFFQRRTMPFPDMSFETIREWQMGDYVILEKQIRGTHTAPFGDLAPTGNSFAIIGVDVFRFVDESIVELWSYYDPAQIQAQIRKPAATAAAPTAKDDEDDDE